MAIHINNQKPAQLHADPFCVMPLINPTDDQDTYMTAMENHLYENYIDPLFQPINQNTPVTIEDNSGGQVQTIDRDMVAESIKHLWTAATIDVGLEDQVNEIYRQGIQYHQTNDWYFEEQLGVEAITRSKMPLPSQKAGKIVQYSASVDVIPTAKTFLSDTSDSMSANEWFGVMSAYTHSRPFNNYLMVTVETNDVLENLKQNINSYLQMWQVKHTISQDILNLINDFNKIDLKHDLSSGLFLPGTDQTADPLSFARIITYAIGQEEQNGQNGKLTIQPTNLRQVYSPENIIIMNLENYAHAKASDIRKEWDMLEKAFNAKQKLRFTSNKRLMTASKIQRNMMGNQKSDSASSRQQDLYKSQNRSFSGKPIPARKMMKMMKQIIESRITQQQTENVYKTQKKTYMRPNRRDPLNTNIPGKLTTTSYRPDIHIYLDTSGSISETQYRDAIMNLIMLTKKINCNLYLSSFSSHVSQTTLIKTRDRTVQNIYKQIKETPKVTGGTDFEQVWKKVDMIDDINRKNGRSYQINFMITDFGYSLSRGHRWDKSKASVKNMYYVPISTDKYTWDELRRWADEFRQQMIKAGDHDVGRRMLL